MYLDTTPTQTETRNSLFTSPRDVPLREKWVNSTKRKDFIPGEQLRVCSQHFHGAKSKADQTSLLYFHCFLSQTKKASKNTFATRTSSQKEENWDWKIKSPSRCCSGRSGFFVWTCQFQ